MSSPPPGIVLSNGTTITHGSSATIKSPFSHLHIPVTMHELSPGAPSSGSFAGQFGFIDFDESIRLPRHLHIAPVATTSSAPENMGGGGEQHFTSERILVLNGMAMVELNGEVYAIPPKTLVTIARGVPHTWTACPAGVTTPSRPNAAPFTPEERKELPVADGTFLMVYEYEEVTGFFPTAQTGTLEAVGEYVRCDDLERIRFPALTKEEVYERCWFVWGREVWRGKEERPGKGKGV